MTFNFASYLKNILLTSINCRTDCWIILNAIAYYEKGIFTDEDIAEIQSAIDEKNNTADNK